MAKFSFGQRADALIVVLSQRDSQIKKNLISLSNRNPWGKKIVGVSPSPWLNGAAFFHLVEPPLLPEDDGVGMGVKWLEKVGKD